MTFAKAIAAGGLVVGVLDGLDAIVFFGLRGAAPASIFQFIAAGLLGRRAFVGGAVTAWAGVAIHFSIATTIVAVACVLVLRFPTLARNLFLSGAVYGLSVWTVMNLVVVPLSAAPRASLAFPVVINGLLIHVFGVGLPAMYFARMASRE